MLTEHADKKIMTAQGISISVFIDEDNIIFLKKKSRKISKMSLDHDLWHVVIKHNG
jgi:hypothetical protein